MKYIVILGTADDMVGEMPFENLELCMGFFGGVVVHGLTSPPVINRATVMTDAGLILCVYDSTGVSISVPGLTGHSQSQFMICDYLYGARSLVDEIRLPRHESTELQIARGRVEALMFYCVTTGQANYCGQTLTQALLVWSAYRTQDASDIQQISHRNHL